MAADLVAEGDRWWAHIAFLADDKLQGRDVGSDGYTQAAQYVAAKMETFGLKPAGVSGYFQPVTFETRQLVEDESSMTLVRDLIAAGLVDEYRLFVDPVVLGRASIAGSRTSSRGTCRGCWWRCPGRTRRRRYRRAARAAARRWRC
jgi:hypothetical protein